MSRALRYTIANIGKMFDFTPRGRGPATKRVASTEHVLRTRQDMSMMRKDFNAVGKDLSKAISRYVNG